MSRARGPRSTPSCPDDGALLGWLDHALSTDEQDALAQHVARCASCSARVAVLREGLTELAGRLARHDPEPPPRAAYDLGAPRRRARPARHSRAGLPWGIAAGLLVAVAVAAGPARAWLLEHVLRQTPAVVEVVPPEAPGPAAGTSFEPRSPRLTIAFDAGPEGRTLTLAPATGSRVTLDAPPSRAEVVVRPDRIEVHDAGEPAGAYRLAVPATVREVVVRVAGVADVVIPSDDLDAPRSVALPPGR